MKINDKVQQLRKEAGLSQEKLAEKMNVSRQAISKWEAGSAFPSIEKLSELSKVLNTTVGELLSVEEAADTRGETVHKKDDGPKTSNAEESRASAEAMKEIEALRQELNEYITSHSQEQIQEEKEMKKTLFHCMAGGAAALWMGFIYLNRRIDRVEDYARQTKKEMSKKSY